ncbi:hypothetical protein [Acinetobacter sp. CIP 102136]|uniref:hypothetical protein n=1 Tax=Acinetobacter sp. CIP 102136 TaxID=1144665 RepID=UPI0002CF1374|nr:hypothetical protein [Acinetobacter sp. CIP 102136]ENX21075.1 hypothetical protein F893_01956 [Acinetobacter sp. CIP 102136]
MAARKVNTPGAPEKAPEPVSTAEQADAALEHITGQDAESQDQSTNETSSLGTPVEPTAEELAAKKEYEEFLQWRKTKGESAQPATQHAPTDPTAKRTRQVVGPNGWITEEY